MNFNAQIRNRSLRYYVLPLFLIIGIFGSAAVSCTANDDALALNAGDKTLLAVFAHPDDESYISPMFVKYVQEGVDVHIVIATDGRLGVSGWSDYEAGDELAAVRREEMKCAADILGVNLIHLAYEDQFRTAQGYSGFIPQSRGFIDDLHDIMEQIQPDVVVTFGPDGFSNHIDHRLAGITTSHVILSREWDKKPNLFYAADPASILSDNWKYGGVDEQYLTVQVPFNEEQLRIAREAVECHASQFRPEDFDGLFDNLINGGNKVYLRPFEAPKSSADDLFDYPNQYK